MLSASQINFHHLHLGHLRFAFKRSALRRCFVCGVVSGNGALLLGGMRRSFALYGGRDGFVSAVRLLLGNGGLEY